MEPLAGSAEDGQPSNGNVRDLKKEMAVFSDRDFLWGLQRVEPLLGDPRGRSPSGKFRKQPKGWIPVRCGLPQCETCLTTSPRFRSLGGRDGVVCGFLCEARAGQHVRLYRGRKFLFDEMNRPNKAGSRDGPKCKKGNVN